MEGDKAIDGRLATIEGHIRAVRKMLEEDKNRTEVITQLIAIERSVKKTGVLLLKDYYNGVLNSDEEEQRLEFGHLLEMYL